MKRFSRGTALLETALTCGIGLTILLFALKVGALGFLQITADAAAFVDAHGVAIGTNDPLGALHMTTTMFPQLAAADVVSTPLPAPSSSYPVDYGFNGTVAEQGATGARHGGVSMVQPLLQQTTVTPHGKESYLGKQLGVKGQAVEPLYMECGPHYNVSQSTSQCGAIGQPSNYAVNYFTQGENTPPYFLSFNFRYHCNLYQPWTACIDYFYQGYWEGFGVAEALDANNWGATTAGAVGTGVNGGQPVSTFEYMACHQRVFTALASFFNSYPTMQSLYTAFPNSMSGVTPANQLTGYFSGVQDYRNWLEFNNTYPVPSVYDNYIREIYNWDYNIGTGSQLNAAVEPYWPYYSSFPGRGC